MSGAAPRHLRKLGLLGGMSWESTTLYYQWLNRLARERLGGQHSARLVIWSDDFGPIAAAQAAGDWDALGRLLATAARELEAAGAEAILIGANTMHKLAPQVSGAVGVPVVHVADATARALRAAGVRRPLLLATRFTMEGDFYRGRLAELGVEASIPSADERTALHAIIYDELIQGRFEAASRAVVVAMTERAAAEGADGVIFGCTEIGLLVAPDDVSLPVFETTEIHARAAMAFAFGD
ncbi:aspartate/glutamate racemase family protein [Caulobacter sp. KR2-114]|uniref:aspartate/glutamate racemase family protein n=1 Tax=Caulobacter sp. KR2-114 TaxID=3400912 RepID=UPI003C0650FD